MINKKFHICRIKKEEYFLPFFIDMILFVFVYNVIFLTNVLVFINVLNLSKSICRNQPIRLAFFLEDFL